MTSYFNPYSEQGFFGFFQVFFMRAYGFLTGKLHFENLVSDEIQLLVLSAISISGALVGTFLVLRNMTMLANALSHTMLIGIMGAYLLLLVISAENPALPSLKLLLLASLISGLVTTFLTEFLRKVVKLQEDASIGLVFTSLFALGILLVTVFTQNIHLGTDLVIGNVDALKREEIPRVFLILGINVVCFTLFFKEFQMTSFDAGLARTMGISSTLFNYLLMVLTSLTAMSAFRSVGVLMILAFFVGPTLIARRVTNRLGVLLVVSSAVGVLASFLAVALSRQVLTYYQVGLSTAGIVVCLIVIFYIGVVVVTLVRERTRRMTPRKGQGAF